MNIGITGTGCYLPTLVTNNTDFGHHNFLNTDGTPFGHSNAVLIEKFKSITGIGERRYVKNDMNTSDMGFIAAERAIADAGVDKEELDQIIFAHNFGNIPFGKYQGDTVPSLATRVKHQLHIKNPKCIAYDLLFGCPGWIQGAIQAQSYIKSGMAKKCLVIGAETLSRVIDEHDRDSMIYSDGAGATIIEATTNGSEFLGNVSATYAEEEAKYLFMGDSYAPSLANGTQYIKMYGRKIYEFAVTYVPKAMKDCLDSSGRSIGEVKKVFIHQANEKMDEAIVKRFYQLYGMEMPDGIMPMNIHLLGNSSVATIPTLFDMVKKGELENQTIQKGDIVIFASVGAGMNINAMVYKV